MTIAGLQKLTLLDYPDNVACIVFTGGCNFKCPFCQNSTLIHYKQDETTIEEKDVMEYLEKRKNVLDGVVISGGEPTIQKGLKEFIIKIRKLGLNIKLDTNGYNPKLLKELIDEKLVDYVAMDIKNSISKYQGTIWLSNLKIDNILESINILKTSGINHEFRTTIMKEYHTEKDINEIIDLIGPQEKYYLQNFKDSENVLDRSLHGFSEEELINFQNLFTLKDQKLKVRGL